MRRKRNPRWCEECKCVMVYDKENDRYICPKCHGIFYPGDKDDPHIENDVITTLMREKYKANLPPVDPLPAGEALKGAGGGSSKGRSRKGEMKKKSLNQLYKEL
jgi:hypothetical protein